MNSEMELAARLKALEARIRELERVERGRFSGARVYNSAALTIAHNTATDLTFNSERSDTDGYHSTSTNTDRLTAPVAGQYLIIGNVRFASNSTGVRQLAINLNGADAVGFLRVDASLTAHTTLALSTIYDLVAGDYVTLRAFQTSAGDLDIEQATYSPAFMIARLD